MKKRVLLAASYSVIEPLGLLHLGGLARDIGYERSYHLVKDHNFEDFFKHLKDFKPNIIGFNVYTGNHIQLAEEFKRLKKDYPNIATVVGGPHPTYFPLDSKKYADYVVMSEGFGTFRKILNNELEPGIYYMESSEKFPHPDRETFYSSYPEHGKSRIKSMITMTGCPYRCTYCYNSSTTKDIKVSTEIANKLAKTLGQKGRLFPHNVRTVEDVVNEGIEIAKNWPTEVIYFQDDVFGFDDKPKGMLDLMVQNWPEGVGLPYHAQMRFEMTKSERRLDMIRKSGGFGLTLAIESADYTIRKEVLDRAMPEELMYDGMKLLINFGFKIRTEQITGLPYGATSNKTNINLDADLDLVKLNLDLREKTKGPTMAWASTFAPYAGTKLGIYSQINGFYEHLDNFDVPDTFFDRSVLRFLKNWVGPEIKIKKDDKSLWLDNEELETYRNQNSELRRIFNLVTLIPKGYKLAESYLKNNKSYNYKRLGDEIEQHLTNLNEYSSLNILNRIRDIREYISSLDLQPLEIKQIKDLAPYFGVLPKGKLAIERYINYGRLKGFSSKVLSDATRHHLYDEVLYSID